MGTQVNRVQKAAVEYGRVSVAILEAECGKVCLVPANLVRFIDLPPQ